MMYPQDAFPARLPPQLPPLRTAGPGGFAGPMGGQSPYGQPQFLGGPQFQPGFGVQPYTDNSAQQQFQGGPQYNQTVGQVPADQRQFMGGPFAGNPLPSGPGGNSDAALAMAHAAGGGNPNAPLNNALAQMGQGLQHIPGGTPNDIQPVHMQMPPMHRPFQMPVRGFGRVQGANFLNKRPY